MSRNDTALPNGCKHKFVDDLKLFFNYNECDLTGSFLFFGACSKKKDHAGVTRVLIAMEKNNDIVMDPTFNGAEAFVDYRASDEFPKWQAYVKKRDE